MPFFAGIVMPGGKPVANNFPCVSMMDWRGNGSDTARTWALQMTIDILGNEEKKVFPSNVSSSSSSSSSAATTTATSPPTSTRPLPNRV
jgi:hypothetical protein